MSVFNGAANTTIHNGHFTAVANVGIQKDIVALLHSHGATAGLLDARERFDAPKCDEGTRSSMILGMKKFVQDGDASSSPALYWLHGPAGVGKSALAQSLSLLSKAEGDHAASFFFSRTSPGRNNGNQLIVTLAYQLARNIPSLQRHLSKYVKKDPAIFTASNSVQMQSLIIDPINKWCKSFSWNVRKFSYGILNIKKKLHPRLILVDGLDECDDPDVQRDLILCIASAVRQLSVPLRFVIASRPESHILSTFELDPAFQGLNGVTVTKKGLGDDEDADEQIRTFLLKEFAEIRRAHPIRDFLPQQWPRQDQIEQLVSKSSKGFIYPATVVRYIRMPNNRPDECLERILGLSKIPTYDRPYEPIDGLYRHIFESIPEINKASVRNIFHFLVLPSTWDGVTNPKTIERHYDYMAGHVQHILRDLLCLIAFTDNGCIKVLHASLPDFLLDQTRSGPLCIDVGNVHTAIAAAYLLHICDSDELPSRHSGFAEFLDHMMEADMSNTLIHDRLYKIDLLSLYSEVCSQLRAASHIGSREVRSAIIDAKEQMSTVGIEGVAFIVAYLLVLVVRSGSLQYISAQIVAIKAFVLQEYPFATSTHAVHNTIIPVMAPLFRHWRSTIYHHTISRIFTCKATPSQIGIREAIFELHVLMMAPLCQKEIRTWRQTHYVRMDHQTGEPEPVRKRDPNYWAGIVLGDDHSSHLTPLLRF